MLSFSVRLFFVCKVIKDLWKNITPPPLNFVNIQYLLDFNQFDAIHSAGGCESAPITPSQVKKSLAVELQQAGIRIEFFQRFRGFANVMRTHTLTNITSIYHFANFDTGWHLSAMFYGEIRQAAARIHAATVQGAPGTRRDTCPAAPAIAFQRQIRFKFESGDKLAQKDSRPHSRHNQLSVESPPAHTRLLRPIAFGQRRGIDAGTAPGSEIVGNKTRQGIKATPHHAVIILAESIVGYQRVMVSSGRTVGKSQRYDSLCPGQQPAGIKAHVVVAGKIVHGSVTSAGNPVAIGVAETRINRQRSRASHRHRAGTASLGDNSALTP